MKFEKIKFKRQDDDEDLPWLEGEMERVIFKDCAKRVSLSSEGLFDDYPAEKAGVSKTVRLTASCEVTEKIVAFHRAAFDHVTENAAHYEARLLDYLLAKSKENVASALSAKDSSALRTFVNKHSLAEMSGLKKQIAWSGLTLYDHGWEEVGFVTFEFSCGWDWEHGISILMHKGKIVAETGLGDWSCRGDSLIDHAKCIQEFTRGYDIKLP